MRFNGKHVSAWVLRSMMLWLLVAACAAATASGATNQTFVVAAYNVENWLTMEAPDRPDGAKPEESKEKAVDMIALVRPDVLGVSEMGTRKDLADLTERLKKRGLDYPHQEWVEGADRTRHVALLSRFPIARRYSRTDYTYEMRDRPMRMQRGILDVQIRVNRSYSTRIIVVHLKSKREIPDGDQQHMRLEEARLLRAHIGKALKREPELNLLVMGDLNDTDNSETYKAIVGEPPFALVDLQPVTEKGYKGTHYWRGKREFSRIDYLLASPGLANEFVKGSAKIAQIEGWFLASDHLLISAEFYADDRKPLEPARPVP